MFSEGRERVGKQSNCLNQKTSIRFFFRELLKFFHKNYYFEQMLQNCFFFKNFAFLSFQLNEFFVFLIRFMLNAIETTMLNTYRNQSIICIVKELTGFCMSVNWHDMAQKIDSKKDSQVKNLLCYKLFLYDKARKFICPQ